MDQKLLDELITKAQEYADNNDKKALSRYAESAFDKMYYEPSFEGGIPDDIYEQLVDIYDEKFGKDKTYHETKGVGAKNTSIDTRKDVKLTVSHGDYTQIRCLLC